MELGPNQKKWLAALRSGDYKQTRGQLRDGGGFCCLGVAVEVLAPARWHTCVGDDDAYLVYGEGREFTVSLPADITYEMLGLHGNEGQSIAVGVEGHDDKDDKFPMCSAMNDRLHWSFETIAHHIESNPEQYFKGPR